MDNEFYVIAAAFATNLLLLIISEILGMTKNVEPNSVTELVGSTAATLGRILIEKLKPREINRD